MRNAVQALDGGGTTAPEVRVTASRGCVAGRGTVTILGMIAPGKSVSIPGPSFLSGKRLQGSLLGSTQFPIDMPRLCEMYLDGRLDLDTMVAERITLDQVNHAMDNLRKGDTVRSVITFA